MRKIWLILLLALTLAGCKTVADIKPDTIVDIPLRPTEAQTASPTEAVEPTQTTTAPTEMEPVTEAPTEKPSGNSGGNKPSGNSSGSKPGGNSTGSKPGGTSSGGKTDPTEKPTQAPTEAPPQAPTVPAAEPPTEPPTEALTEAPTVPPTEPATMPPSYDPAGYVPSGRDRAVADAVNAARQEAGLEPLTFDSRLCAIASVRAWELTREWSHRRPDGSDGLTVLAEYGYGCGWAAENLYNGASSGEKIAARWLSAESTAGNILSASARVIGVGSYTTEDGLTCVAAIFAG